MDNVSGFSDVLPQRATVADVWSRLQNIRTYGEQVRGYMLVLKGGKPSIEYEELAKEAAEEWSIMEDALTSPSARNRILELNHYEEHCPTHRISLPASEAYKLKTLHVATAKNCCASVILWTGN